MPGADSMSQHFCIIEDDGIPRVRLRRVNCLLGCRDGVCIGNTDEETIETSDSLVFDNESIISNGIPTINKITMFKVEKRSFKVIKTKEGTKLEEDSSKDVPVDIDLLLIYSKGKLVSGKNKKQIRVYPSDLKQKVDGISEVHLVDDENPKYVVNSKKDGRLFGLIPVSYDSTHIIDANNGNIIKEDAPWWTTLVM